MIRRWRARARDMFASDDSHRSRDGRARKNSFSLGLKALAAVRRPHRDRTHACPECARAAAAAALLQHVLIACPPAAAAAADGAPAPPAPPAAPHPTHGTDADTTTTETVTD